MAGTFTSLLPLYNSDITLKTPPLKPHTISNPSRPTLISYSPTMIRQKLPLCDNNNFISLTAHLPRTMQT